MQLSHLIQKTIEHVSAAIDGHGQLGVIKFDLPFNPEEGRIDLAVGGQLARVSFEVIVPSASAQKGGGI